MNALSNAPSMPDAMPQALPRAKHATYATQLTGRFQDQGEKTHVPDAAGAVDNGSFVAWFDRELTDSEASVCLARTRALLEKMQAEQEALARELDESGVTGFVAQSDWLIAHRSPIDVLAAEIKSRRIHSEHADQPVKPCDRCGIPRVVRVGRQSPLCADCRYVLSREEIALWAGEKVAA